MEAACTSETLINFYQSTHHHIPEDSTVHMQTSRYTASAQANQITKHIGTVTSHLTLIKGMQFTPQPYTRIIPENKS
jgi:hypothetical protein